MTLKVTQANSDHTGDRLVVLDHVPQLPPFRAIRRQITWSGARDMPLHEAMLLTGQVQTEGRGQALVLNRVDDRASVVGVDPRLRLPRPTTSAFQ